MTLDQVFKIKYVLFQYLGQLPVEIMDDNPENPNMDFIKFRFQNTIKISALETILGVEKICKAGCYISGDKGEVLILRGEGMDIFFKMVSSKYNDLQMMAKHKKYKIALEAKLGTVCEIEQKYYEDWIKVKFAHKLDHDVFAANFPLWTCPPETIVDKEIYSMSELRYPEYYIHNNELSISPNGIEHFDKLVDAICIEQLEIAGLRWRLISGVLDKNGIFSDKMRNSTTIQHDDNIKMQKTL